MILVLVVLILHILIEVVFKSVLVTLVLIRGYVVYHGAPFQIDGLALLAVLASLALQLGLAFVDD